MAVKSRGAFRAALAGAVLLAMAGSAGAADNWNFYIHQSAPQLAVSRSATQLAEAITKATNGQLRVRRHFAGSLQINTTTITDAVGSNVVQMGDDLFYSGNIPVGAILSLPFLLQSYDDYAKASAVLRPYVEEAYKEKGVVVLAAYAYPMQYVWGRREIASIGGLKNAKIRVASPEQGEFIRRFGGIPVTIGASEVPSALDRGVVDGIITSTVGADLWRDMLGGGILVGLNYNVAYIIANAGAFDALPPDVQKTVRAQAAEAANWSINEMKGEDATSLQKLDGKFKITRPSDAELKQATNEMTTYWDVWAKSRGPKVEEALAKVRAALGR